MNPERGHRIRVVWLESGDNARTVAGPYRALQAGYPVDGTERIEPSPRLGSPRLRSKLVARCARLAALTAPGTALAPQARTLTKPSKPRPRQQSGESCEAGIGLEHRPVLVGNYYDKYGTTNPVERRLMHGFLRVVTGLYEKAAPRTVLEVGCGEGLLAQHLLSHGPRPERFDACDLSLDCLAPGLDPMIQFHEASIYNLPWKDKCFDLVVCCEVLEHLTDPERGMRELGRVCGRAAIVSTPREPLWRLLNMVRGSYWTDLGNTPGHLQHFTRRGLERLVSRALTIEETLTPLPWTVVLGTPGG